MEKDDGQMMTQDKQRMISDEESSKGSMNKKERYRDKASKGSEGNIKRKMRLETFQTVFALLVIRV